MKTFRAVLLRLLTTRVAWPIVITIGLLCTASILALQIASPALADRQKIHIALGCGILFLAMLPHFQNIGRIAYALMAAAVVLLALVFLTSPINGSTRWFQLTTSVQLQPSELAKIAFVLSMGWYLRYRKDIRTLSGLLVPFLLMLIPFGLILKEPDLGTALLFPLTLYAMLIAAGARLRHLISIALIVLVAAPGAFPLLESYQQERIRTVVRHWISRDLSDKSGSPAAMRRLLSSDYQQMHSLAAVGSGGATGEGQRAGQYLRHFPHADTDFVFVILAARWGLVGCCAVLLLYLPFFAASVEIAGSTKDQFGRLLVVGLASIILCQALINVSMTIALLPVVGITLPFVSYGGSSLLTNMLAAGLLLNVSIRRYSRTAPA